MCSTLRRCVKSIHFPSDAPPRSELGDNGFNVRYDVNLIELPRPIETLLSLPRVRLIDRVPVLETQEYVRRLAPRLQYRCRLVNQAITVSNGCANQFSTDEKGLSVLLDEVDSSEYVVTERSKRVIDNMLNGICADSSVFKDFENTIQPLCEISPNLREVTSVADTHANRAKEQSIDLARALLMPLPTTQDQRLGKPPHAS